MPLILLAGMDAAARIDGALHQRGGFGDVALADLFAGQRATRLVSKDRTVAGVAQPDARFDAVA